MKCEWCLSEIDDNCKKCPNCGSILKFWNPQTKISIIGIACMFAAFAAFYFFMEYQSSNKPARKSLTLSYTNTQWIKIPTSNSIIITSEIVCDTIFNPRGAFNQFTIYDSSETVLDEFVSNCRIFESANRKKMTRIKMETPADFSKINKIEIKLLEASERSSWVGY